MRPTGSGVGLQGGEHTSTQQAMRSTVLQRLAYSDDHGTPLTCSWRVRMQDTAVRGGALSAPGRTRASSSSWPIATKARAVHGRRARTSCIRSPSGLSGHSESAARCAPALDERFRDRLSDGRSRTIQQLRGVQAPRRACWQRPRERNGFPQRHCRRHADGLRTFAAAFAPAGRFAGYARHF